MTPAHHRHALGHSIKEVQRVKAKAIQTAFTPAEDAQCRPRKIKRGHHVVVDHSDGTVADRMGRIELAPGKRTA